MRHREQVFLTAEWRDLAMLNYVVEARTLQNYVPQGTVLDTFMGKTYVSLVAFRFCRTRLFGSLPIPLHTDFDEVNLRFYVRRDERGTEIKRGVVFIAEIVPRQLIASTARILYGENYICLPMEHRLFASETKKSVTYRWKIKNRWCVLTAEA